MAEAFYDGDAVIARLNRFWKKRFGKNYEKSDERHYELLSPMMLVAIANAKSVRETSHQASAHTCKCNSSTDVYDLVERLFGKRPSEP